MPDWSTSLPAVLTLLLSLTHIVICILALGVFPGSRKPSTAMAWLILVLAVPYFGFLIFLLFGRTSVGRKRREWQLDVNRQVVAGARSGGPGSSGGERRGRRARAGPSQPEPRRAAAHLRQHRGDHDRLPGLLRGDAPRGGGGREVRPRPVLHLGVGRDDRPVLRGHGRGGRAWRRRTVPLRPPRLAWHPGLQGHDLQAGGHQDRLGPDASRPAAEGRVPAAGPAQPPQDPGRGRPGRVRRVAEPDRARLQQAEEPQARTRVGRADDPGGGPDRAPAQPGLRHRLVQRDEREPAVDARAGASPLPLRLEPRSAGWAPRSSRAGPGSRPRTTSASSTACCTPPNADCR